MLLQGIEKSTVGSRAGFPQAVYCTNYELVLFYYVSLTSYSPYKVDHMYKIFISSSAISSADRCSVPTVLYMYFCRHYLLIFKAVCATFSHSWDTCFISCISVMFFLLYGTMAFPLSFIIQPCKFAMKIQQHRHKIYLSVLT